VVPTDVTQQAQVECLVDETLHRWGKVPFQTIWEYMDAGYLHVEPHIPQGLEIFMPQHL